MIWRRRTPIDYISLNYQKFESESIRNFKDFAKKIISRFGTDGKKIIIQPIVSTNDNELGYQHLKTVKSMASYPYIPKIKSVFEVDLNNPQEADYILEHIAHIMGTYDMAFIFKEWVDIDADYGYIPAGYDRMKAYLDDHRTMITAVDFDGFLHIEDIHSGLSKWGQILLDGYSTDSGGKTFFDKDVIKEFDSWNEIWIHLMGFSTITFQRYYFREIKNGVSDQAKSMRKYVLTHL